MDGTHSTVADSSGIVFVGEVLEVYLFPVVVVEAAYRQAGDEVHVSSCSALRGGIYTDLVALDFAVRAVSQTGTT